MEKKYRHHQPQTLSTTKKTFFYSFIPSKLEEEQCMLLNKPYQVTKSLYQFRDIYPPPSFDPANPWRIRRTLTSEDVTSGRIFITFNEAFDHVFRYWSLETANAVVMLGNKLTSVIWYLSDESKPASFTDETVFFDKGCDEGYNLGILDLVKSSGVKAGDEIGLYWDLGACAFIFKVLHRQP